MTQLHLRSIHWPNMKTIAPVVSEEIANTHIHTHTHRGTLTNNNNIDSRIIWWGIFWNIPHPHTCTQACVQHVCTAGNAAAEYWQGASKCSYSNAIPIVSNIPIGDKNSDRGQEFLSDPVLLWQTDLSPLGMSVTLVCLIMLLERYNAHTPGSVCINWANSNRRQAVWLDPSHSQRDMKDAAETYI